MYYSPEELSQKKEKKCGVGEEKEEERRRIDPFSQMVGSMPKLGIFFFLENVQGKTNLISEYLEKGCDSNFK